jgi:hypothetical protein
MSAPSHASSLFGILVLVAMGSTACSAIEQALVAPVSGELHGDLPLPSQLNVPVPKGLGEGAVVSPFTRSGELAGWAQAALDGADPASFLGSVRAQNASWWSTGVEVLTGERETIEVNATTLEDAGGWANVRATSDVTFDRVEDLAVYLYAVHGKDARFLRALKVTQDLNPELAPAYRDAIRDAATGTHQAPAPTKKYSRDVSRSR